jgi:ribA/ribD-fused uncharacterized protein
MLFPTIDSFSEEHRFLSNFYRSEVRYGGVTYPTVEHAFQAAKTEDPVARARIATAPFAGLAKRLGRHVVLRDDWERVKDDVMLSLLRQKFAEDPLRSMLRNTGEAQLVEGNVWKDTYWGVCAGKGLNRLGALLMLVRDELSPNEQ